MTDLVLSDETLMAYADGELHATVATQVEAALIGEPALVARLMVFIRTRRHVRAAFAAEGLEPVGDRLLKAAQGPEAKSTGGALAHLKAKTRGSSRQLTRLVPLAACAAGVALGLAAHQLVPGAPQTELLAGLEAQDVTELLGRLPSGERVKVGAGILRVLSTAPLAGGDLCREIEISGAHARAEAISCRSKSEPWTVVIATKVSTEGEPSFQPASSDQLHDDFFKSHLAGPRLTGPDEMRALNAIVDPDA
jgi:hypothetical protein